MKGAIIGDIVGSIYEFDNLKSKDFELFKPECEFTDDSVLTVAVAEALLKYNPDDEDNFMNLGTVYQRELWIDGEYGSEEDIEEELPTVLLMSKHYDMVDNTTIKVKCEELAAFNKNDHILIIFAEDPTWPVEYKIISKVVYEDGDYYHCRIAF